MNSEYTIATVQIRADVDPATAAAQIELLMARIGYEVLFMSTAQIASLAEVEPEAV